VVMGTSPDTDTIKSVSRGLGEDEVTAKSEDCGEGSADKLPGELKGESLKRADSGNNQERSVYRITKSKEVS